MNLCPSRHRANQPQRLRGGGLALCLIAVAASATVGAEPAGDAGVQPLKLFESGDTLELDITAPWRKLIRESGNENPWPATMTWTDEAGQHTVTLTVERRGITRQRVCKFPPIRLRVDKDEVKGTAFRGQDSLKMVTHCDVGSKWQQYYVKEMLAYRLYNRVTELSFRVRPLSVRYLDTDGGRGPSPQFAFLIEDDSDVAKRNGLKRFDLPDIEPEYLEPRQANRLALFQYMIGNVDWSTLSGPGSKKCCHNARLIGSVPTAGVTAIPYDFDSAGLVDAPYAAPNEGLPIRKVTDRLYRGFCVHNATLNEVRGEYLALEPELLAIVSGEERLNNASRNTAMRFLGKFFDTLKDDRKFEKNITRKCRR